MEERNKNIREQYFKGSRSADLSIKYGVSERQINRIVKSLIHTKEKLSYSKGNWLGNIRPLIISLMEQDGRDFSICERCLKKIPNGRFDIHHTKYEGATYYDLQIVCRSCNLNYTNKYLK